jgi:hypothetical protein
VGEATSTGPTFSTRQAAQLIGAGEASVKRWADSGDLGAVVRYGRDRRFELRGLLATLRKRSSFEGADGDLASRVDRRDMDGCVAEVVQATLAGVPVAQFFDERLRPALLRVMGDADGASSWVLELFDRLQPLAEEPTRARRFSPAAITLGLRGLAAKIAAGMSACVLRGRGFTVLSPRPQITPAELAELAFRCQAAVVALWLDLPTPLEPYLQRLRLTAAPTPPLILVGLAQDDVELAPTSATRIRSMQELIAMVEPNLSAVARLA